MVGLFIFALLVGIGWFAGTHRRVLALAALMLLSQAAAAQVTFVVDSVRSGIWVDAEVSTIFGSDADRDSTGLRGTLSLQLDADSIRISSGTLHFADSLRFDFEYGNPTIGSITAVSESDALSLEMVVAGPAVDLIDGAFSQRQNILLFEGVLDLSGSGLFESAVPDDPQEIAVGSTVTLAGALDVEDGAYQLALPLQFDGAFDLGSGSRADILMEGMVYGSGLVSSGIDDPAEQPSEFAITALYPQPARDRARLALSVARSQQVRVEVFDVRGRRVADPFDVVVGAGRSELSIDTSGLSSGLYVVVVASASRRETVPVVVVR